MPSRYLYRFKRRKRRRTDRRFRHRIAGGDHMQKENTIGIAGHVKRDALVITLAAGVRTAFVEKALAGRGRVVRIMPNLACAVGEGATAFALGRSATEHDALVVEEIFGAIGRVTMVDEPM